MEAVKLLKNVNNLNEYIHVSNDLANNINDNKIQFNMSTILALKKVRSIEIEYFNKCQENGAAIKIFELLLRLPLSKTWSILGRELVSLLQYWLDAMRKHLIIHNDHWWPFLQVLLKFLKEISIKDHKLNNFLLEETAECILDLAAHRKPDTIQRHEILCVFNLCGADSSRAVRLALREKLDGYFINLSAHLASCGDVAVQYSVLEALLRWLLPRQDRTVRIEAASKWFPEQQFAKETVEIFLEKRWLDFFQDARDFLNAHNMTGDAITSVECKGLVVGSAVVFAEGCDRTHWLDMNITTGRLSITMEPKDLESFTGEVTNCCGTLVLPEALSAEVKLCREGSEVIISVMNSLPPQIVPSLIAATVKEYQVKITIDPNSDMARIDRTLRKIFGDKYQVLFDVSNCVAITIMPMDNCPGAKDDNTEEKRFSCTEGPKRRTHGGFLSYIVLKKRGGLLESPSSASTSSLAQLRDKLAALPKYVYDKERVRVCAQPQLSTITEVSEEDRQSLIASASTNKSRPYGVCQKITVTKAQIEANRKEARCLSPAAVDEDSVSCLLVATIGSAEDSVINDTLDRFPQYKDNPGSIVDALLLEALQAKGVREVEGTNQERRESHKISGVKEAKDTSKGTKGRPCTVISNSSHNEESTTEFIEETQFSNTNLAKRRKDHELPYKRNVPQAFDEKAVEEFFSQHFAENRNSDLVISPTLAKKINETSSETSEDLKVDELIIETELIKDAENNVIDQIVPNIEEVQFAKQKDVNLHEGNLEVIECVNSILERVCLDFTQPQECFDEVLPILTRKQADVKENSQKTGTEPTKEPHIKSKPKKVPNKKTAEGVKLTFKSNTNTRVTRQKKKLLLAEPSKERYNIEKDKDCSTPPDESVRSNRQKYKIEIPKIFRNRKGKKNNEKMDMTPTSKRLNEAFDELKKSVENNEGIVLVDKTNTKNMSIYNFTSDSEDEDFRKKTVKAKIPNTTKKKVQPKRKTTNLSKLKTKMEKLSDTLVDERMREPTMDVLNTSIEQQKPVAKYTSEIPKITVEHVMEPINEINIPKQNIENRKVMKKHSRTDKNLSLKGKVKSPALNDVADRTESPLPGLLVEATVPQNNTLNESNIAKMVQKFQEMYESKSIYQSERESTRSQTLSGKSSPSQKQKRKRKNSSDSEKISKGNDHSEVVEKEVKSLSRKGSSNLSINQNKTSRIETSRVLKERNKTESKKNETSNTSSTSGFTHQWEIDDVINISRAYSEKSFDTLGHSPITAHGDLNLCENDLPPSKDSLKRKLKRRSLELEDFDHTTREFYTELNKEITEGLLGAQNSKCSSSDSDPKKSNRTGGLRRTRSQFKDNANKSNKKGFDKKHYSPMESKSIVELSGMSNIENASIRSSVARLKTPVVSLTRLSSSELIKWLPSCPNFVDERNSTNDSDRVKIPKKISTGKETNSNRLKSAIKNSGKNKASIKKDKIGKITSTISPIKLFEELKPIARRNSDLSMSTNLTTINKVNSPDVSIKNTEIDTCYDVNTSCYRNALLEPSVSGVEITSAKTSEKKRRLEDSVETQRVESEPSISRVNDWLSRTASTMSQEKAMEVGLIDTMGTILEKLDTTLVEIHHDTEKRLAALFVEVQTERERRRSERRLLYEKTATEIARSVERLIDDRFSEMDKRSEEMEEKCMQELKEKSKRLIREDCARKKAMVGNLREEVQAVVDSNSKAEK